MPGAVRDKSGLVPLRLTNSRNLRVRSQKNVTTNHSQDERMVAAAESKSKVGRVAFERLSHQFPATDVQPRWAVKRGKLRGRGHNSGSLQAAVEVVPLATSGSYSTWRIKASLFPWQPAPFSLQQRCVYTEPVSRVFLHSSAEILAIMCLLGQSLR